MAIKGKNWLILLILGVIFLAIYSYGAAASSWRVNSPDEAANYFWLSQYVRTGQLSLAEPLNQVVGNIIHPRSINVNVTGALVPGSFLGLILIYGWLAKFFGLYLVKFFTPVFSIVAFFCFYGLTKRLWNGRVALISSILLLLHPAFWYYTSRGLLPNVLFLDLLIIGCWFLFSRWPVADGRWLIYLKYFLGGLFVGLALTVRTSEVIWLAIVGLGLVIVYRKKINWLALVLFLAMIVIMFLPILSWNQQLYGGYFKTGYSNLVLSPESLVLSEQTANSEQRAAILPFGFHPWSILRSSWNYYIKIIWWYFVPLLVGFVWFLIKLVQSAKCRAQSERTAWIYLFIFAFVTDALIIYYGSWSIMDNISNHVTIGTSYLRYWLPSFILGLPLVAWPVVKVLDWFKERISKVLVGVFIFGLFTILSANLVFNSEEGLAAVNQATYQYKILNQVARQELDPNSIIITDRTDKIFWPEFKVAVFNGDWSVFANLGKLVGQQPIYYYPNNSLTAEDFNKMNVNLGQYSLKLEERSGWSGENKIYQLQIK
ncbi:MAG: hypothetical protein WC480_02910 [Patescibacteria group bacterium]